VYLATFLQVLAYKRCLSQGEALSKDYHAKNSI